MKAPLTMSRLLLCLQTWAADVREGFVEITRHSLALFGLAVVLVSVTFAARPSLQASASEALFGWLQIRQNDNVEMPASGHSSQRSTASNLKNLTAEQLAVTRFLSRKYRVSTEPLSAMVTEAWTVGERSQLAPTLILAIMAIESRFNPFAAGSQGNVGLMQIETQAHAETLGQFGGPLSAFDPLTNLRVGVRHLQGLMQQTDTLEEALFLYGSSSGQLMESQYVERVLAEQQLLDNITEKRNTAALASKGQRAQL
jgi:soluble lytic murein transglycosylase-like protein